MRAHEWKGLLRPEVSDFPGAKVAGSCNLSDVGVGSQSQVLGKSKQPVLLTTKLSPALPIPSFKKDLFFLFLIMRACLPAAAMHGKGLLSMAGIFLHAISW